MGRYHVVPLAVVAALAAVWVPTVEAKDNASLALDRARPIARQAVRVTIRTQTARPESEHATLVAVGPWRQQSGQSVRYARLTRIGALVFEARLRFAYAGRWRLEVMSESGAILTGRHVTVR